MNKRTIKRELITIFWIFIIGSILGYIFEMTVVLFQKGHFETRQGLIYGPFIPVYGIGGIVYYILLSQIETRNKVKIFFITMVLGGVTEYISSYVQEKVFGTISWDYTYMLFDINGRTSLLHCTYWGIAGVIYVSFIEPGIKKLKEHTENPSLQVMTLVLVIFMVFNISISCLAATRQANRRKNIPPQNKIDVFLDKYYPDEYMNSIYTNMKVKN